MLQHLFLPMHHQFDFGFCSLATAFETTAESASNRDDISINGHLPICFLYRHAIELFLKSSIITLHRRFGIPLGPTPESEEPLVDVMGKWLPIRRVHSINALFAHSMSSITALKEALSQHCKTNWEDVPEDLPAFIKQIEAMDHNSTFFRYPMSGSEKLEPWKSSAKAASIEEMKSALMMDREDRPETRLTIITDEPSNEPQGFIISTRKHEEFIKVLKSTSSLLSGLALGLMWELGPKEG